MNKGLMLLHQPLYYYTKSCPSFAPLCPFIKVIVFPTKTPKIC